MKHAPERDMADLSSLFPVSKPLASRKKIKTSGRKVLLKAAPSFFSLAPIRGLRVKQNDSHSSSLLVHKSRRGWSGRAGRQRKIHRRLFPHRRASVTSEELVEEGNGQEEKTREAGGGRAY